MLRGDGAKVQSRGAQHGSKTVLYGITLPPRFGCQWSHLPGSGHTSICTFQQTQGEAFKLQRYRDSSQLHVRRQTREHVLRSGNVEYWSIQPIGFIATSRTETTFSFLQWWQKRLRDYCYYRPGTGLFVDQIWVTLAPLYFPGFYIERDPGYNMCYWNHFERRLSQKNGRYFVNEQCDLVFYHFSSFDPRHPEVIARRPGMHIFSFADRPDLKAIYEEYSKRLLAEDFLSISALSCTFGQKQATPSAATVIRGALREILSTLPAAVQTPLRSIARLARKGGPQVSHTART